MAIEKILKATAILGIALGITGSNVHGYESIGECRDSVKKVNAEVIDYNISKYKGLILTTQDKVGQKYLMKLNGGEPPKVMMAGFPVQTKVEFPLKFCTHFAKVTADDPRVISSDLFERIGKVMYAPWFSFSDLKLIE